jgi:tyrosyl-tRNA synthetase
MAKAPNQQKIEALLSRGVENVYPSREYVKARLTESKKLTIYLGIDPTGPTLHLGHAIPLMKLRQFQELGHQVILLMGDFTAMIGDPTDKTATRKVLTRKEILQNLKNYKKQASALLSFSGKNAAQFKFNSKWLAKMNFEQVLSLASKMTVQQMLERDMFEKRIEEGKPIHIHEFFYPLMQGYDSVAMKVDGEVGGNDQTFNMLAGRTLLKEVLGKEKFVLTTKLLADPHGVKMGKTEGNMVALSDSPEEMFGKIMSWPDGMIIPAFELCTLVSNEEIQAHQTALSQGINPRDIKLTLGEAVVGLYFGEKKAKISREAFLATFQKGEIPTDVPAYSFKGTFLDTLVASTLVASKGEARRLMLSGAVTHAETGEKILDANFIPSTDAVYRIGKHRFLKITL